MTQEVSRPFFLFLVIRIAPSSPWSVLYGYTRADLQQELEVLQIGIPEGESAALLGTVLVNKAAVREMVKQAAVVFPIPQAFLERKLTVGCFDILVREIFQVHFHQFRHRLDLLFPDPDIPTPSTALPPAFITSFRVELEGKTGEVRHSSRTALMKIPKSMIGPDQLKKYRIGPSSKSNPKRPRIKERW
jgi:hypothetical protein